MIPNLVRHRPTTQKRNSGTPREVKKSLAEVLVVVVVDEDEVEVAVVGSRFRPTSMLLESLS